MKSLKGSYLSYFLMYFFYFAGIAFLSSLISVYLMDQGYSGGQVGIVISASLVMSVLLQTVVAKFNNKYQVRVVNAVVLLVSAVSGVLFMFANNMLTITLTYSIAVAMFNCSGPVVERFATLSKYEYGKIRIWGTIGYAVGSQIAGYIYEYFDSSLLFVLFGISLILCIIGMITTKDVRVKETKKEVESDTGLIHNQAFLFYLIIVGIFYGVTNLNSTYLPSMFKSTGMNVSAVSTVLFFATLMELPVTYFYAKMTKKLTNANVLVILFVLLTIQFFAYALISSVNIQALVTVLTKSVCTMAFIILNMKVVEEIVNEKNQLNALFIVSMIKSGASIIIQNVGGYLLDLYSYQGMYLVLLILALIGLTACLYFQKLTHPRVILKNQKAN